MSLCRAVLSAVGDVMLAAETFAALAVSLVVTEARLIRIFVGVICIFVSVVTVAILLASSSAGAVVMAMISDSDLLLSC
jgi:hypothetical protein